MNWNIVRKMLALSIAFIMMFVPVAEVSVDSFQAVAVAEETPVNEDVVAEPTAEPTEAPTEAPTAEPTEAPTEAPTAEPTEAPTAEPTEAPTAEPTEAPTEAPTAEPTEDPTAEPTEAPTEAPTAEPTEAPTEAPTAEPTEAPTEAPTAEPTEVPTEEPTAEPTEVPTEEPTAEPTEVPTEEPTAEPTEEPTEEPTAEPTEVPTEEPTAEPTEEPTAEPTEEPVAEFVSGYGYVNAGDKIYANASLTKELGTVTAKSVVFYADYNEEQGSYKVAFVVDGEVETGWIREKDAAQMSAEESEAYEQKTTGEYSYNGHALEATAFEAYVQPTEEPTAEPTAEPTEEPTAEPTVEPTVEPTAEPTEEPTVEPTAEPTVEPTEEPTVEPTEEPTEEPTAEPTVEPTPSPEESLKQKEENAFAAARPQVPGSGGSDTPTPTPWPVVDHLDAVWGLYGKPVDTNATYLDWEPVDGAAGYQILRSTSYYGTYSFLKNVDVSEARNYSLTPGGTYYYKVRAFGYNASGNKIFGPESDIVEVSVLGTCDNFDVYAVDTNASKLVWDSVYGATGYQVFRTVAGTGEYTWVKNNSTAGVNNYSLTPGTTYYYKIRAYVDLPDGTRAYGQFTEGKKVHILGTIQNLKVTASGLTCNLDWKDVTGITGYQVFYTEAGTGGLYTWSKNVTVSQASQLNLKSNTQYYFKIRAYVDQPNGVRAYGQYSNAVNTVTGFGDPAVYWYEHEEGDHVVNLIGFDVLEGNIDGYTVYRKTGSGSWQRVCKAPVDSYDTYTDSNGNPVLLYWDYTVVPNTSYVYTVQAYSNSGKAGKQGVKTKATNSNIPTPYMMEARGVKSGTNQFYISYNDDYGIEEREVQYSTSSSSGFQHLVSLYETTTGDYSYCYYDKITDLNAGQVYYFRVRNVYEKNGKTYYSNWSSSIKGVIPDVAFYSDTPTGTRSLCWSDIYNYTDVPIVLDFYGLFYATSGGSSYLIQRYSSSGDRTIGANTHTTQTWDFSTYSSVYAYSTHQFFNTFTCNGYEYGIAYNTGAYAWSFVGD